MTARNKTTVPAQVATRDEASLARLKQLRETATQFFKGSATKELIAYPGQRSITPTRMLEASQKLRDEQIWAYPILPGAITVFQQLASNREWKISGSPRAASRAVEWLNNAQVLSPTGFLYYGFEGWLKRRALDWIAVGRTACAVRKPEGSPLEYIDPTELRFRRRKPISQVTINPVSDNEQVWRYVIDGTDIRVSELFIDHALPVGGRDLFIAPVAAVLPSATLAWLLREFDTASLDGRRIRDIILTSSNSLSDALEEAILEIINVYAGADPSDIGVQVVTLNGGAGVPVKDMVYRLGLANIPEAFDRKSFTFNYVNEIAAALGLAMRQFYNDESTTNRSLEQVQEQRQQAKGPSAFIRSEQRLINNSGMLKRFGAKTRFGFFEEVDAQSELNSANVLKLTAEALASISAVFGASIDADGYLAWMQSIGVIPAELEIMAGAVLPAAQPTTGQSTSDVASSDASAVPASGETIQSGDTPASQLNPSKWLEDALDYSEVTINQHGEIVERRSKVFTVIKAILTERNNKPTVKEDANFDQNLNQARSVVLSAFKYWLDFEYDVLTTSINTSKLYTPRSLLELCSRLKSEQTVDLSDTEQAMVSAMLDMVTQEPASV